jgi:flagellum-specific ATP synthase
MMPDCLTEEQNRLVRKAKRLITRYEDMEELIKLGAYRKGSDPEVDEAILRYPLLEEFLAQHKDDSTSIEDGFEALAKCLGLPYERTEVNDG